MHTFVLLIFLYACKNNTGHGYEVILKHPLNQISYKDYATNNEVYHRIETVTGPYENLLTTVKKGKMGVAMSVDEIALPKPYSKALFQEPEEEKGNIKHHKGFCIDNKKHCSWELI